MVSDLRSMEFREEKLQSIKNGLEVELVEANTLIGSEVLAYLHKEFNEDVNRGDQDELKRKIERIKIKLEDIGSSSGGDVVKEYQETLDRDSFLAKELDDLSISIDSLQKLIIDLKATLDKEFKEGVSKINKQFQDFFALMFGGGGAFLSITMEHRKAKKVTDEEIEESSLNENDNEEEIGFERGIEINVSLPHKKVKDLNMLSGERGP